MIDIKKIVFCFALCSASVQMSGASEMENRRTSDMHISSSGELKLRNLVINDPCNNVIISADLIKLSGCKLKCKDIVLDARDVYMGPDEHFKKVLKKSFFDSKDLSEIK